MNTTLVTICMPANNVAAYISEAIESVLNQTYSNIELIIVNDGSTDNTLAIIKKYNDKRLKVFSTENLGQCKAANLAFKYSKGDYIKFMDADDIISPNFLEDQVKKLGGAVDKIASASWGRFYNDDLGTFKLNPESVWRDMKASDWLLESLGNGPNMMQCALWLIPREILSRSGLWNEKLTLINDFDFFIRVIMACKNVLFTKNAILYYRSGLKNSLSQQKTRNALESAFLSTQLGIVEILKNENTKRTRLICANVFQEWNYKFYPQEMDLYLKSKKIITDLGGSDYVFPSGGYTKLLVKILGWRLSKRIKILFKKTNEGKIQYK